MQAVVPANREASTGPPPPSPVNPPFFIHPFLRFIPTSSQPAFPSRERFGSHYRGTFERKLIARTTDFCIL